MKTVINQQYSNGDVKLCGKWFFSYVRNSEIEIRLEAEELCHFGVLQGLE